MLATLLVVYKISRKNHTESLRWPTKEHMSRLISMVYSYFLPEKKKAEPKYCTIWENMLLVSYTFVLSAFPLVMHYSIMNVLWHI
jgi:hypothetical protein